MKYMFVNFKVLEIQPNMASNIRVSKQEGKLKIGPTGQSTVRNYKLTKQLSFFVLVAIKAVLWKLSHKVFKEKAQSKL